MASVCYVLHEASLSSGFKAGKHPFGWKSCSPAEDLWFWIFQGTCCTLSDCFFCDDYSGPYNSLERLKNITKHPVAVCLWTPLVCRNTDTITNTVKYSYKYFSTFRLDSFLGFIFNTILLLTHFIIILISHSCFPCYSGYFGSSLWCFY